ncbi:MAG TPA: 4a-hydroxytetrahydrobiopterin dehydratase [Thermoguttaceae bacterium]|nr:4a-hydroxytetrahydrobiopterin dehydratase [Thermoguttaceae bacterium]
MTAQTSEQLRLKRCAACQSVGSPLPGDFARRQLEALPGWELADDGRAIRKEWQVEDFQAAIDFLGRVAQMAEYEGHHPDFHLTNYRHVVIVLSTHSIGGLSENDFILAAKIDWLPVQLRQ